MDDLIDTEWAWVEAFLADKNAPSAAALRGYLNDRITERLVTARQDERERLADGMKAEADDFRRAVQKKERERVLREAADVWQRGEWTRITEKVKDGSVLGAAQVVADWLRDRADNNGGEA